jgi:hypothetical protein
MTLHDHIKDFKLVGTNKISTQKDSRTSPNEHYEKNKRTFTVMDKLPESESMNKDSIETL